MEKRGRQLWENGIRRSRRHRLVRLNKAGCRRTHQVCVHEAGDAGGEKI
jgi:hypothetical protein